MKSIKDVDILGRVFCNWKYLLSLYLAEANFICDLSVVEGVVEHVCLHG